MYFALSNQPNQLSLSHSLSLIYINIHVYIHVLIQLYIAQPAEAVEYADFICNATVLKRTYVNARTPNRRLHHHHSQQTLVVLRHYKDSCTTTVDEHIKHRLGSLMQSFIPTKLFSSYRDGKTENQDVSIILAKRREIKHLEEERERERKTRERERAKTDFYITFLGFCSSFRASLFAVSVFAARGRPLRGAYLKEMPYFSAVFPLSCLVCQMNFFPILSPASNSSALPHELLSVNHSQQSNCNRWISVFWRRPVCFFDLDLGNLQV